MPWKNCASRILLWNKRINNFLPIIPNINGKGYETRCINPEQLNLNGMVVRIIYLPLTRVMQPRNNGTGLTGFFGEIWNFVGYYLNFTLIAENVDIHHHNSIAEKGIELVNTDLLQSNKADIAIPMNYDDGFSRIIDYLSFTSTCIKLYIPASFTSDDTWLLKMITYDILLMILAFIVLISIISYSIHKCSVGHQNLNSSRISFCDMFFYTFAGFTNQGSTIPFQAENRSRILSITKRMLAWLFLTMSTGNLFYLMSKMKMDAIFTDISSLLDKSDMPLIIPLFVPGWRESVEKASESVQKNRIQFFDTFERIYEEICQNNFRAALWQNELVQRTMGHEYNCTLVSFSSCKIRQAVVFGISKSFHFKHSLIIGILKLQESGLMSIIEQRWISAPMPLSSPQYHDVSWKEVKIIFAIYIVGLVMSIFICVIENIHSAHEHHRLRKKWKRRLRRIAERLKLQE